MPECTAIVFINTTSPLQTITDSEKTFNFSNNLISTVDFPNKVRIPQHYKHHDISLNQIVEYYHTIYTLNIKS